MKLGRVIAGRHLTRGRGKRPVAVVEIGQPQKVKPQRREQDQDREEPRLSNDPLRNSPDWDPRGPLA